MRREEGDDAGRETAMLYVSLPLFSPETMAEETSPERLGIIDAIKYKNTLNTCEINAPHKCEKYESNTN